MKERTWPLTLRLMWPDWSLGFLSSSWEDGFATPDILLRSGDLPYVSFHRSTLTNSWGFALLFILYTPPTTVFKVGLRPKSIGPRPKSIGPIPSHYLAHYENSRFGASSFDRRYRPCLIRFIEAKCNILSKMIFSYLFYHKK